MNRSHMVVTSLAIPAFVLLAHLSTGGTDSDWEPEESRSVMFRPSQGVQSGRPAHTVAAATLAKWNAPHRAIVDIAGRDYLPGTRQPLGARRTLASMSSSAAKGDEPMSVLGPNGPVCSVTNPDPTGPSTICSTPLTGCNDPEPLMVAP